jgi:hypothetical protein
MEKQGQLIEKVLVIKKPQHFKQNWLKILRGCQILFVIKSSYVTLI